jgi:hypothetical protein
MSSVDFTGRLWLNLASDPSQKWWFTYITAIGSNPAPNVITDADPFPGNVALSS